MNKESIPEMQEAYRIWVKTREKNCNSFREAFNGGYRACLDSQHVRNLEKLLLHIAREEELQCDERAERPFPEPQDWPEDDR